MSRPSPAFPPIMDLIGGPQGSGKSTFFPVAGRGLESFNIDEHRRHLNGGSSQGIPEAVRHRATADYRAFIEGHLRSMTGFSIEVTLAKGITFRQAERARKAGFLIQLTYVAAGLDDCIERVANRVDAGGHGVSAEVLRRTYAASMRNLSQALAEFDTVQVYDNSTRFGPDSVQDDSRPTLVLESLTGRTTFSSPRAPSWLRSALTDTPYALT